MRIVQCSSVFRLFINLLDILMLNTSVQQDVFVKNSDSILRNVGVACET